MSMTPSMFSPLGSWVPLQNISRVPVLISTSCCPPPPHLLLLSAPPLTGRRLALGLLVQLKHSSTRGPITDIGMVTPAGGDRAELTCINNKNHQQHPQQQQQQQQGTAAGPHPNQQGAVYMYVPAERATVRQEHNNVNTIRRRPLLARRKSILRLYYEVGSTYPGSLLVIWLDSI